MHAHKDIWDAAIGEVLACESPIMLRIAML